MSSQLAEEILLSNSQVYDLGLSLLNFIPFPNVPALNIIQLFQQHGYSPCTATASQLCVISNHHQLTPPFCSKACLNNPVQDQESVACWSLWPALRAAAHGGHHSLGTFCSLSPLQSAGGDCLRCSPLIYWIHFWTCWQSPSNSLRSSAPPSPSAFPPKPWPSACSQLLTYPTAPQKSHTFAMQHWF